MTLPRRKRSSLSSLAKNVLSKSFKSYLQVRCAMILNCAGLIEDLSRYGPAFSVEFVSFWYFVGIEFEFGAYKVKRLSD